MKKHSFKWHGKNYYLLFTDEQGTKYYLQDFSWDCDWYWGGGYVETFTNNRTPNLSADIQSHQHFNTMFFNGNYEKFLNAGTPFTLAEKWQILELLKTFYIMREYSDTLHRGGAHFTTNLVKDIIKNEEEYNRINKEIIPAIREELIKILTNS